MIKIFICAELHVYERRYSYDLELISVLYVCMYVCMYVCILYVCTFAYIISCLYILCRELCLLSVKSGRVYVCIAISLLIFILFRISLEPDLWTMRWASSSPSPEGKEGAL